MPAVLSEIRSIRLAPEDELWLEHQAMVQDRSLSYCVLQLVKQARLADGETTRKRQEGEED